MVKDGILYIMKDNESFSILRLVGHFFNLCCLRAVAESVPSFNQLLGLADHFIPMF